MHQQLRISAYSCGYKNPRSMALAKRMSVIREQYQEKVSKALLGCSA